MHEVLRQAEVDVMLANLVRSLAWLLLPQPAAPREAGYGARWECGQVDGPYATEAELDS